MTRKEQKEQRRILILKNALDLFVEKGYAATTTSEIAKAVGMSEGLLFHYFASKEKLYMELVQNGVKGIQVFSDAISDPYDTLYQVINNFMQNIQSDRIAAKMFVLMNMAQNPAITPVSVYNMATTVNIIQESVPIIEQGQRQGIFRDGDALSLAYTFWNAFDGNMTEIARNPKMPLPDPQWLMAILAQRQHEGEDRV